MPKYYKGGVVGEIKIPTNRGEVWEMHIYIIYAHMSGYIGIVLPSSLHAQLGHCLREGGIPE